MKILFVSDIDVSSSNYAGNKNAFLSLAHYLSNYHEIHHLNLHRKRGVAQCFNKTFYFPRYINMLKRKLISYTKIQSKQRMVSYKSSIWLSLFVKFLDLKYKYDYVIVEYLELHCSIDFIEPAKRICDLHDIMYLRKKSFIEGGLIVSSGLNVTLAEELMLMNKFSKLLVIQENELQYLSASNLNSKLILVKRSPINVENLPNKQDVNINKLRLGFIGNTAEFNVDAFSYILDELLPQIELLHDVELVIAGAICNSVLIDKNTKIRVLGLVDKVGDFYKEIDVLLNPIRYGSGLKTKNIEALSYGVPVLTTRCGIEGMDFLLGSAINVFDNKDDFLKSILIYKENTYSNKQVKDIYFKYFGPDVCYRELLDTLND